MRLAALVAQEVHHAHAILYIRNLIQILALFLFHIAIHADTKTAFTNTTTAQHAHEKYTSG